MTELRRCPFCGGEAEYSMIDSSSVIPFGIVNHFVTCKNHCLEGLYSRGNTKEEAIEAWNKRANPWHTCTPTEEGFFAVYYYADNEYDYGFADWNGKYWEEHFSFDSVGCRIIAWQKIEPYKED